MSLPAGPVGDDGGRSGMLVIGTYQPARTGPANSSPRTARCA